jgi:rhodanese-related sulfurtransferase
MPTKLLLLPLLLISLSFASLERDGVRVKVKTPDNRVKEFVVKRFIPKECKKIPINNEMLWTGNFANKRVPEVCKSTYVHTKGKLLPMHLDEDLETYGELEVLAFLREMQTDDRLLLIDSRKEQWFIYRTIPGATNMPFHYFKDRENYEFHFEYALQHLGVTKDENGDYDFSKAKTLVLFCNGPWCSQSPSMIFALLEIGYPPENLKWYRGGMQDWLSAGMTSTRP